jgi:hypothetical protein
MMAYDVFPVMCIEILLPQLPVGHFVTLATIPGKIIEVTHLDGRDKTPL